MPTAYRQKYHSAGYHRYGISPPPSGVGNCCTGALIIQSSPPPIGVGNAVHPLHLRCRNNNMSDGPLRLSASDGGDGVRATAALLSGVMFGRPQVRGRTRTGVSPKREQSAGQRSNVRCGVAVFRPSTQPRPRPRGRGVSCWNGDNAEGPRRTHARLDGSRSVVV